VCKADNLTTILGHCHVIWEPQLPGILWASQDCNGTDLLLPASKLFDKAQFEILEAITLYCTLLDPITNNFKAN